MVVSMAGRGDQFAEEILEEIGEDFGRAEAEALAWLVWGLSFALAHVVAFAVIGSAVSLAVVDNVAVFPMYALDGMVVDTLSVVWAWLVGGAFVGAYVIATAVADGMVSVAVRLHVTAWLAAVAAGQWLAGRNGWLVGREELGSLFVSGGLIVVGVVAMLVGGVSWLGVGLAGAAVVILAARAFMLWRSHRDALVLKGE
jgi:hypothetical protein